MTDYDATDADYAAYFGNDLRLDRGDTGMVANGPHWIVAIDTPIGWHPCGVFASFADAKAYRDSIHTQRQYVIFSWRNEWSELV